MLINRTALFSVFRGAHSEPVTSVAIDTIGGGKRVITGSLDTTAKLWDMSGTVKTSLYGFHTHKIDAVAFLPSGEFATVSYDTVGIWGYATASRSSALTDLSQAACRFRETRYDPNEEKIDPARAPNGLQMSIPQLVSYAVPALVSKNKVTCFTSPQNPPVLRWRRKKQLSGEGRRRLKSGGRLLLLRLSS